MEKVKKMVAAGSSIPAAIKEALAQAGFATIAAFASHFKMQRSAVTNQLNGNVRVTGATIEALISVLGGSEMEWRELLWQAAKPSPAASSGVVGL